ncbi:hypothetical protein Vretimale_9067 [Volvox reticuliferus]|uniref:Nucleotide-diphospho-sugar transferase domain-containing protein n=1 Tax=Volvox reticuliferus TaxID=1737510 RepID=A0A8J4GD06_9CHLO|nr:hypothetical protein Vretifemale_14305 [Volvox reticuliferus]GIM04511.1 hypothetical protein Vretimale_9067 [Volvox reticuliferus]
MYICLRVAWVLAFWAWSSIQTAGWAAQDKTGSWPNMTIAEVTTYFMGQYGPLLPNRDFIAAAQAASLEARDAFGRRRRLVLLSMASESTFRGAGLWELFLSNLRNITFNGRDGSQDHLANHLVARVMTLPNSTADNCNRISNRFGTRCITITSPMFTADDFGYKTPPFFGLSFAKTLTILDALALGLDVFFLDCDQIFFRNPLPYILARDIDVLVSGDCSKRQDSLPVSHFPPGSSNIGLLYLRATPLVTRAVANWLYYLVQRALQGRPKLDQSSFKEAMEWVSGEMGAKAMSVAMLRAEYFPHWCLGQCGCDTEGMELGQPGWHVNRLLDGTCKEDYMIKWYNFHVPCNQRMDNKARTLQELLSMYTDKVGLINSGSEHLDVI